MKSKLKYGVVVATLAIYLSVSFGTLVEPELTGAEKQIAYNKGTTSISESNLTEQDFFKPMYHENRRMLEDCEASDDSERLQTLIDTLSYSGGGIITIKEGTYYLADIALKSNLHIVVEAGTVLKAYAPEMQPDAKKVKDGEDPYPKFYMFKLGFEDKGNAYEPIHNVSITCTSEEGYTIDLTGTPHYTMTAFKVSEVDNFQISDVIIQEKESKFAAITVGAVNNTTSNGIFKNIKAYNNFYGYGLCQLQSGQNLYFENIYGEGGATLRLESGTSDGLENPPVLDNIYARGVICEGGKVAFMTGPHEVDHGHFDVRGVSAYNSGFAVNLGKGFGARAGSFAPTSTVSDIKAVYGESSQLKVKDIVYMLEPLRTKVKEVHTMSPVIEKIYTGPSIAAVLDDANYKVNYDPETIVVEDFLPYGKADRRVITQADQAGKWKTN